MREAEREALLAQMATNKKTAELESAAVKKEYGRLMAEQAEAAREQRVAELMTLAGRRLQQLVLSRGWQSWVWQWADQRRNERLLKKSAGRLSRPRLTASFVEWHRDWEAAVREVEREALMAKLLLERNAAEKQEAARRSLKEQLETQRRVVEEQEAKLQSGVEAQEVLKRLMAEQAEVAREQRVAELMALAGRRLQQLVLSRGWQSWVWQWADQRRNERLLKKSAGRLSRPRLTASFVEWHRDWEAAVREAEREALLVEHRTRHNAAEVLESALRDQLAIAMASSGVLSRQAGEQGMTKMLKLLELSETEDSTWAAYVRLNQSSTWSTEMVNKAARALTIAQKAAWAQALMAQQATDTKKGEKAIAAAEAAAAAYVKAAAVHAAATAARKATKNTIWANNEQTTNARQSLVFVLPHVIT